MFKLESYKTSENTNIIICSGYDYINLFSLLKDIKEEWDSKNLGKPARFLFDLFLTNGNESNRFAYLDYDGLDFVLDSYKVASPNEIDSDILEKQDNKYLEYV